MEGAHIVSFRMEDAHCEQGVSRTAVVSSWAWMETGGMEVMKSKKGIALPQVRSRVGEGWAVRELELGSVKGRIDWSTQPKFCCNPNKPLVVCGVVEFPRSVSGGAGAGAGSTRSATDPCRARLDVGIGSKGS